VDVVVCNNMVAIALSNNVLMRLDLSNPSEIDRKYAKISELFHVLNMLFKTFVLFIINSLRILIFSVQVNIKAIKMITLFIHSGVDITKRVDDSIHRIFMDPTARHLLVCMKSQESFYLARNSKKPKPLAKMKVHVLKKIMEIAASLVFCVSFMSHLHV